MPACSAGAAFSGWRSGAASPAWITPPARWSMRTRVDMAALWESLGAGWLRSLVSGLAASGRSSGGTAVGFGGDAHAAELDATSPLTPAPSPREREKTGERGVAFALAALPAGS